MIVGQALGEGLCRRSTTEKLLINKHCSKPIYYCILNFLNILGKKNRTDFPSSMKASNKLRVDHTDSSHSSLPPNHHLPVPQLSQLSSSVAL